MIKSMLNSLIQKTVTSVASGDGVSIPNGALFNDALQYWTNDNGEYMTGSA